jgi:hypothetical protein
MGLEKFLPTQEQLFKIIDKNRFSEKPVKIRETASYNLDIFRIFFSIKKCMMRRTYQTLCKNHCIQC